MKPSPQNKNILFIRLRLLGDIIFTIPALHLFREQFPQTRVYYVVEEEFREIGELIPGVHQLIVIPRRMSVKRMWAFRREIRRLGIDTVVDFHGGPKSAQLTWLTGAKCRIGYRTPNRNWAYNRLTPRKFGDSFSHSVYNQAKLLEHLGITIEMDSLPPFPNITVAEDQVGAQVKEIVKKEKKAVIHVGAGNAFRDWGLDNFSSLIRRLRQYGVNVILVGSGEKEIQRGRDLDSRLQAGNLDNLVGKLTIKELLFLISRSEVYLGADSGPLHLASLTATPLVALYGPNVPEISGPWRKEKVTIIRLPMPCQPCNQRTCIYGIIPCMKNISTDVVYEAIRGYLQ